MSSLKDKMYQWEVAPPAQAWEKIAAALDESSTPAFASRLLQMEIAPPVSAWEAIAESLDEAPTLEFPGRLRNLQVVPPAGVWEKINETLGSDEHVMPMRRRASIPVFLRYAAAAVFIGALAFGIVRLLDNSSKPGEATTAQEISSKDSIKLPANSASANIAVEPAPVPVSPVELSGTSRPPTAIAKTGPMPRNQRRLLNSSSPGSISFAKNLVQNASNRIYAYEDHVPSIAERYVVLMTPDGNFIRMAKKWGSLLCCVSGEEQDAECKDQLKKWQEKIANSPIAAAPGNFMDIMSLVNSLSEDTQL